MDQGDFIPIPSASPQTRLRVRAAHDRMAPLPPINAWDRGTSEGMPRIGEKRAFTSTDSFAYPINGEIRSKSGKFAPQSSVIQQENFVNSTQISSKELASNMLFTSIQNATRLIDQALSNDQNLGNASSLLESVASFSSLDYGSDRLPGFVRKKFYPIPKEIQDKVDAAFSESQGRSTAFVGVFAGLKFAWATIDNKLYLWDFETASSLYVYDEIAEPIVKIDIAEPRPDVFVAEIKHILVIATPSKIHLLGIVLKGNKQLMLRKTGFEIPLGGFLVTHIQSCSNGRIFVAGDDGHLYEITYDSEERWFKKKCGITDKTSSWLKRILPAKTKDAQIVSISYDSSRHLLYALNNQNDIRIFNLADDDEEENEFRQIAKITRIHEQLCEKSKAFQTPKKEFSLLSIHPISRQETSQYFLIAVSTEGYRIYFSIKSNLPDKYPQISVSHIRLTSEESSFRAQPSLTKRYTRAFSKFGVFIGCSSYANESFSLSFGVPNYPRIINRTPNYPLELWTESIVEDELLSIAEYSSLSQQDSLLTEKLRFLNNYNSSNELLSQHFKAPMEFLLVTNTGIEHVRKVRPIDKLQILIVESKGNLTDEIRQFFDQHKLEQSCAMCISLACENSSRLHSSTLSNVDLYTWSIAILSRLGGEPQVTDLRLQSSLSTSFSSAGDIGFALAAPEISFSPLHNSLYIYLTRLVRPILKSKLNMFFKDPEEIVLNSSLLLFVLKQLQDFKYFLGKNESLFMKPETLIYSTSKQRDLAIRREKESILSLISFIERMTETISFYLFFMDHGNVDFFNENRLLFDISFETFLSTAKGLEVSREIINSIFLKEIKQDRPVVAMCDTLKAKCPSFFSHSDVLYYQASESLYRALTTKSQREREEMLAESLRFYIQTCSLISCDKFLEISKNFSSLSFYTGIVTLGLAVAHSLDPDQFGYKYLKDGKEDSTLADFYQNRCNIYEIVFSFLQNIFTPDSKSPFLVECQNLCSNNRDDLFHWKYFEFLIKNQKYDLLISSKSTVAESFLVELFKQLLGHSGQKERLDLLWKYYIDKNKGVEASQVLFALSEASKPDLLLSARMEYLSIGIATAKSLIKDSVTRDKIVKQIEDQIEIARIQLEMLNILRTKPPVSNYTLAIESLERGGIFDFSTLYNKYAKPLGLPEAALLVLNGANFDDSSVMVTTWQEIIDRDAGNLPVLKNTFLYLAKFLYRPSTVNRAFPVHFLVGSICKLLKERGMPSWIVDTFRASPAPLSCLYGELEKLYYSKSGIWHSVAGKSFIISAIGYLISCASQDAMLRKELQVSVRDLTGSLANLLSNASVVLQSEERAILNEFELSYRKFISQK